MTGATRSSGWRQEREMSEVITYRAPGRTEIIGNHCDHQNGCVIAAAINLYIEAAVQPSDDGRVLIRQEGHPPVDISLHDTGIRKEECGLSRSLVRGVADYFIREGYRLRGFTANVDSHVPVGSGVSSSAAYEILIGRILTDLSDRGQADPVSLALAGRYAESEYFGKPSGLMDQMAIAAGGLTYMDFADPGHPVSERLDFDVEDFGYRLCLINTGGSHAGLTDQYASIPREMQAVARCFGQDVLRNVRREDFYSELLSVRERAGDRALLRAAHFFDENDRVLQMREAVRERDIDRFLLLVRESGRSSHELLQNICPAGAVTDQSLALGLLAAEKVLDGAGACRVHGGGFAGTIQAYVPRDAEELFKERMELLFGAGSCRFVSVAF